MLWLNHRLNKCECGQTNQHQNHVPLLPGQNAGMRANVPDNLNPYSNNPLLANFIRVSHFPISALYISALLPTDDCQLITCFSPHARI